MNTDKTTARAELRAHHQHVADLIGQASALLRRIGEFQSTAAAAQPAITNLEAQRAGRHELLAAVAVGESDSGALDLADQELEAAEARVRIAARGIEVASAGAERLTHQHEELVGRITAASKHTAELQYHAAVEAAQAKLEPYRDSLAAMGRAYAALLGGCIAVEHFVDTTATPPRLYVTGDMRSAAFGAPLPSLPGLDRALFDFDFGEQVATATAASMAALSG